MPDTPIPVAKQTTGAPPAMRRPETDLWRGFHDEIDRMFGRLSQGFGFGLPSFGRLLDRPTFETSFTLHTPAVDVSEDDKAYRITAELPGIAETDLDVTLNDNTITIKGEKRDDREQQEKDYHLTERRYGAFQRSFIVPPSIDRDKIAANFDKGILTLTLPKTAAAVRQQKKIEVTGS
jgi:HSP20 family protein